MTKLKTLRREFLAQGLTLVGAGAALPAYLARAALAAPDPEERARVLVVIQLSGGHDALSALVPHGRAEYHKARKTTRITEDEVLKLDEEFGFHPNLKGFLDLWRAGQLAVLPGVGYPDPNYSHFTSTDIWHTAAYVPYTENYGWIGRTLDAAYRGDFTPGRAIAVGTGKTPRALFAQEHPGIAFSQPESFRYTGDRGNRERAELYQHLNLGDPRAAKSNLDFIAATAMQANAASAQIRAVAAAHKPAVTYPSTTLGRNLRVLAGLICGELPTRVFFTETGGFDTHRGQRERHDALMAEVNDALTAFQQDLQTHGRASRVLTMTTSEFGRRVVENGSEGTDHGAAACQFLVGPGVKQGIHGAHPSLTDLQGGGGGSLKHTTDFRSLYATVLEKWLGVPSQPILRESYPLVDCLT